MTLEKRAQKFHTDDASLHHYPDLGSTSDWLNQISHAARPIRSTSQTWVETRLRRHLAGKPVLVGESKSTLHPSLFRRHHCPVLENEWQNGERIGNDCDGNSTTFFLFFSSSDSSRSLCLNQPCSQILSPTRPSLSLSLSLPRDG